jgi:hypothetical protein
MRKEMALLLEYMHANIIMREARHEALGSRTFVY